MKIKFCKRCLYGDTHPLKISFDIEGICSGCRIHEEKDKLNWLNRWDLLNTIVEPYKSKSNDSYDCIVPISGSQDSYYIIDLVKEKLKMNPLLVTYNKYFNTPLGIKNLANLRIKFDCDILYQNINPLIVKKIIRSTLRDFGSIYWPILAGQSVFPVQTAVRYKIPLIIWGAHQGLEQVGMFSHEHEIEMTRRYRKEHDLMGYEADDLLSVSNFLEEKEIWQYRYPDDYDLNANNVRGIYLGNYVRWDPKTQHEKMIKKYDYMTTEFSRTFDTYDYVDCYNYMNLHDLLKLYKHGYSKVTDHASREIRYNRISRAEGEALVRAHELKGPEHLDLFEEWLGLERNSLQFIMDQHRNKQFWEHDLKNDNWQFKGWSHLRNDKHKIKQPSFQKSFVSNSSFSMGSRDGFITFGKGYP